MGPLLQIFCGETAIISKYADSEKWLDWICGFLLNNTPWIDHKNELRSLLTLKTSFYSKTNKGSIEWMFGCIMSKEYQSILYYVNKIFPSWFGVHLCYFLRRINRNLMLEWPRNHEIERNENDDEQNENLNDYLLKNPKMTLIEWIFEYYVEELLFLSFDSWIWLKNYLYFFKRRGLSMLSLVFEQIDIKSDKMAYFMLQTVNEFNLNDNVYNMVCLRMAQKSYINNMQYGRICYWCCKMKGDKKENTAILDKYLAILITKYLEQPSLYINTLHDVCDNANCSDNKSLILLSKLRDCYLCRYDLQKLDSQYILNKAHSEHKQNKSTSTNTKNTPFTTSRGLLIDALSKPHNENNKNLKNLADSFQLYPTLNLEPSPFPKSAIKQKNKEMQERASSDFILKNLITPPRPTPSRKKKMSHRKTSRSHSLK